MAQERGHSSTGIPEVQDHSSHLRVDIQEEEGHSSVEFTEDDSRVLADMEKKISNIKREVSDEPLGNIKAFISLNCGDVEELCVGPHHPEAREPMEQLKIQCLDYVIQLSKTNLKEYWQRMLPHKRKISESYECREYPGSFLYECSKCSSHYESRTFSDAELIGMMILDGCLILEYFRFIFFSSLEDKTTINDHPIAKVEMRKLPIIFRDLLQLGNQIPFLVLEQLFQVCHPLFKKENDNILTIEKRLLNIIGAVSLCALGVGGDYVRRFSFDPERFEKKFGFGGLKPLHLLDLLRLCFNSPDFVKQVASGDLPERFERKFGFGGLKPPHLLDLIRLCFNPPHFVKQDAYGDLLPWKIPNISKLRMSGIKVNPQNQDHYKKFAFQGGAIQMPRIILSSLTCYFLKNCVEFEQQSTSASKPISFYVLLLDILVDTSDDIDYLHQRRVLELGKKTNAEAVDFINNLGTKINFYGIDPNFFRLCSEVKKYYQNEPRKKWVSFKSEYIEKPWLVISVLAASVLLILTCIQTHYAIHPQK